MIVVDCERDLSPILRPFLSRHECLVLDFKRVQCVRPWREHVSRSLLGALILIYFLFLCCCGFLVLFLLGGTFFIFDFDSEGVIGRERGLSWYEGYDRCRFLRVSLYGILREGPVGFCKMVCAANSK
jgi:hypothetical protein